MFSILIIIFTQSILVLHPSCHQTTALGPFFAEGGEGLIEATRRVLLRRARNSLHHCPERFNHPLRSRHRVRRGEWTFDLPGDGGKSKPPCLRQVGSRSNLARRKKVLVRSQSPLRGVGSTSRRPTGQDYQPLCGETNSFMQTIKCSQ